MGLLKKDAGTVCVLGSKENDLTASIREQIGVVFDGTNFSEELTPIKPSRVLKDIYRSWDQSLYLSFLERLSLPENKKIKTFSKGMKMKLSIAVAFSHHPKLLLLDEPTSGLDPVMRNRKK